MRIVYIIDSYTIIIASKYGAAQHHNQLVQPTHLRVDPIPSIAIVWLLYQYFKPLINPRSSFIYVTNWTGKRYFVI